MKVFLSWSGDVSHRIAVVLRDWIPSVIQTVDPYVSSEDIDKGARWSTDIAKELQESSYGIICVTHENLTAPWLNFEAGALSKAFEKSNVSPFLFNIKRSEVKGPVLQFQSTIFTRDDVYKLMQGINNANDEVQLEDQRLEKIFSVWWPSLEEELNKVLADCPAGEKEDKTETEVGTDNSSEILEEVLDLVRSQQKILNSPEQILPRSYLAETILRYSSGRFDYNPRVMEDLERSYFKLREFVSEMDKDDPHKEELEEILSGLDKPVRYMTKSFFKSFRLRRDIDLFGEE